MQPLAASHPASVLQQAPLVLPDLVTDTGTPELLELLHLVLEAYHELRLRVDQLEHTEHIRLAVRPYRDLGIDY